MLIDADPVVMREVEVARIHPTLIETFAVSDTDSPMVVERYLPVVVLHTECGEAVDSMGCELGRSFGGLHTVIVVAVVVVVEVDPMGCVVVALVHLLEEWRRWKNLQFSP